MKVGFFGGTFNPPHFGHLSLAIDLKERAGLDEVWFCPARANPLRLDESLVSCEHRLKLVELAVSDIPGFRVLDLECHRQAPSYAIDTLRFLTSSYPHAFRLIMGSDAVETFFRWREPEAIIQLAPPLVGLRSCRASSENLQGSAAMIKALEEGWTVTPVVEISSTMVRQRLRQKLYCGHLVPVKALDYITEHHLY